MGTAIECEAAVANGVDDIKLTKIKVAPPRPGEVPRLVDEYMSGALPLSHAVLHKALSQSILLLGSAPVGPTTVSRLQKYAGKLPTVRFGSTETCLQVMGTPLELDTPVVERCARAASLCVHRAPRSQPAAQHLAEPIRGTAVR